MLKLNLKFAMVFFTVALFAFSCEKETELVKTEPCKTMDATESKILNFKAEMKSSDKSGKTFSIDTAVWYIEAALNHSQCMVKATNVNLDIIESKLFTDITSDAIDVINVDDYLTMSEITAIFVELQRALRTRLRGENAKTKFFTIADVEFKAGKFKMVSEMYIAEKNAPKFNFPSGDFLWSFNLPQCDQSKPDAMTTLYRFVDKRIAYPVNSYWTDIQSFHFDANHNVDGYGEIFRTANNPFGNYMLFYRENIYTDLCQMITNDEMQYYGYHGVQNAIDAVSNHPLFPEGKELVDWLLLPGYLTNGSQNPAPDEISYARHKLWLSVGIKHVSNMEI